MASKFILTPSDLTFFAHSLHPLRDKTRPREERRRKRREGRPCQPTMYEKKMFLSGNMILILEAEEAEVSPGQYLRKRPIALKEYGMAGLQCSQFPGMSNNNVALLTQCYLQIILPSLNPLACEVWRSAGWRLFKFLLFPISAKCGTHEEA